jgi:colanic acid/amylovoran biosynthesis glycosyltransferase
MKKNISIYHYSVLPLSETFIYRQLKGLQRYFDVKLLTREIENRDEFPGFEPFVIPCKTFLSTLLRLNGRNEERFFAEHLKGSHLFHVNFGHIAIWMQHYALRLGIPMTTYFLGVDASAFLKDQAFCDQLGKATFAAVFVNSEDMKRRLTPYLPHHMRCHVAYCGIPLERFPFKQRYAVPEGARFLQVSRFEPKKGVDITLKAFSRYLKESDPKARLIIGGDGPLKSDLLRLSDTLGLGESISFPGRIGYAEYIELLQNADVFIQPSVTSDDGDMEGLPTAICEAMACGLPVISTRHSGIPEIIDDGENGFLVEERDIDGIFARMASLRTADIAGLSRHARMKIERKFDHNRTVAVLSEYMSDIINRRSP